MSERKRLPLFEQDGEPELQRPRTRADCVDGPRPCPWYSCRHNTQLRVSKTGRVTITERPESCALDVADRGGQSVAQVAAALGISRQAVQDALTTGLVAMRKKIKP